MLPEVAGASIEAHHIVSGFLAWFLWRTVYLAKLPTAAR
jgi:hypothetical protein